MGLRPRFVGRVLLLLHRLVDRGEDLPEEEVLVLRTFGNLVALVPSNLSTLQRAAERRAALHRLPLVAQTTPVTHRLQRAAKEDANVGGNEHGDEKRTCKCGDERVEAAKPDLEIELVVALQAEGVHHEVLLC